jgi:hypothetical protein
VQLLLQVAQVLVKSDSPDGPDVSLAVKDLVNKYGAQKRVLERDDRRILEFVRGQLGISSNELNWTSNSR